MRYQEILEACWSGYQQQGMKKKGDRMVPNCVPVSEQEMEENLRKWFKEKWVRFGPDGKIRGDCARGSESEGKPKCLPQSKAQALGKKGRASAAAKKRREDPNPERRGPARNVATKVNEFAISKGEDDPNDLTDEAYKDGQRLGMSLVDGATRAQGFEASRYLDRYLIPFSYGWNAGRKAKIAQARRDGVELAMKKDGSLVRAEQGVSEGMAEYDRRRRLQRQISKIESIDFYITDDDGLIIAGPFEGRSDATEAFERLVRQRQDINIIQGRALIVKLAGLREEQGVAEAVDRYELKITDQWEDEDPESYGTMDEYEFDVLKNGQSIGTARANNYFADLYVDLNNGKHLKLSHQKHQSHPLMKEYERLVWGLDEGQELDEKQDACYRKVKSRYKVWPSAYASGALVQCRKKGAANWGTGAKKK